MIGKRESSKKVKEIEVFEEVLEGHLSNFQLLKAEVDSGRGGKNKGIPMGFDRLNHYIGLRKKTYFLVGGLTGCLSGDTIINVRRRSGQNATRNYTLEDLYYKFNNLNKPRKIGDRRNGHKWDKVIPTKCTCYKDDLSVIGYNEIINVFESGIKETYLVTTKMGKSIKATFEHRFLTDNNVYKHLKELAVGDTVYIRSNKVALGRKPRPYRKEFITSLPYYSSATDKQVTQNGITYTYQRIKRTRAVYDAGLNNLSLSDFMKEVKFNSKHSLVFSNTSMELHHKDKNPQNDVFSNLQLLTKEDHARLHGDQTYFTNREIECDKIVSIEKIGKMMTYDIEMKAPYHNFLANDIVVHNSGKTSLVDDAFVLNPIDWILSKENTKNQKLHIIYRSMERSKEYKLGKWVCRKIFIDTGKILPLDRLLGWTSQLDEDDYKLFLSYQPYIDALSSMVTIIDGAENPIGVANDVKKYALSIGRIIKVNEFENKYIPDDPNLVTVVIIDHIGLLKATKDLTDKKQQIDKMSNELRYMRDFYGFTPVVVSQFNRSISNILRIKNGDVEPALDDFKDSASTQEDCDVALALFDPMRYKVEDPSGYDLSKLRDQWGAKYFRSLRLIKNSYGEDDVRIGLGFLGQAGIFKELPKRKDMTDTIYEEITDKTFFIRKQDDGEY